MLFKLNWRSFLRQIRNYLVYFICMMIAVMIFYIFSAMTYDQILVRHVQQDIRIEQTLDIANMFVGITVLFFMLNANHFFLDQRQKEINGYQLLGLRKSRIMWLLSVETIALNIFSLISGILMGIVFSKLFSMVLVRVMGLNITSDFFISWNSIGTTVLIFFVAMGLIAAQIALFIWRKQENRTDSQDSFAKKQTMRPHRILAAVVGGLMLLVGYYLSFFLRRNLLRIIGETGDYSVIFWLPLLILGVCMIGTFLVFAYTLPVIIYFLTKKSKNAYRGLRFVILHNVRNQVKKNWKSLSSFTIVTAVSISVIGGTMGYISFGYQMTTNVYPVDYQVINEQAPLLKETILKNGGEITDQTVIDFKMTGGYLKRNSIDMEDVFSDGAELLNVISESNYRKLQQIIPELPKVTLQKNQTALFDTNYNITQNFNQYDRSLFWGNDEKLRLKAVYPDYFGNFSLRYSLNQTLLVADSVYNRMEGLTYSLSYVNAHSTNQEALDEALATLLPLKWLNPVAANVAYHNGQVTTDIKRFSEDDETGTQRAETLYQLDLANRYPTIRAFRRQAGILVFVVVFIGLIVLITTSSTLILRQFSNVEKEMKNYELLKKLGVTKRELRKIISRQNLWIFMTGTILAVLHSLFALHALTQFVSTWGYWIAYLFTLVALLVYFLAYRVSVRLCLAIVED